MVIRRRVFGIIAVLFIVVSAVLLTACGGGGGRVYKVVTPDGAPYAGLVHMRHESGVIGGNSLEFELELESNLKAVMTGGNADFIIAPTNVGAALHKAYADGDDIAEYKLAAGVSWGVLYLVTNNPAYLPYDEFDGYAEFMRQFNGGEIDTIGRAAIPGKALDFIISETDCTATVQAAVDASEIIGKIQRPTQFVGVLGEPALSKHRANPSVTVLASISDIYHDITGGSFPMAAMFVKASTASESGEFVAEFMGKLSESIAYFNANPAQVATWADGYADSAALKPDTLPAAAEYMNVAYKSAQAAKGEITDFLTSLGLGGLVSDSLFL